jgi:hypothetical protein
MPTKSKSTGSNNATLAMNTRSKSKGNNTSTTNLKPTPFETHQQKTEEDHDDHDHEHALVPLQTSMQQSVVVVVPPTTSTWATPLFSWSNLTRYTYTFLCPCSIMYEILMEELIHVHHHSPVTTNNTAMPTVTVGGGCCSCLSHLFFPCCFGQFVLPSSTAYSQVFMMPSVAEEEPSLLDSSEISSLLQDFCSCCPNHIINTQYDEPPQHHNAASLCNNAMMLSMGCVVASGCFIPTTCILRQITTQKYHHNTNSESCWNSGLVSCFAWPCGLVQVMDEIHIQEHMMNTQT